MTSERFTPQSPAPTTEELPVGALTRFEAWLRSRGHQPVHDPFVPPFDLEDSPGTEVANDLVRQYLEDRPAEEPNRELLLGHALAMGEVMPLWGDSVGCDLALWQ